MSDKQSSADALLNGSDVDAPALWLALFCSMKSYDKAKDTAKTKVLMHMIVNDRNCVQVSDDPTIFTSEQRINSAHAHICPGLTSNLLNFTRHSQ